MQSQQSPAVPAPRPFDREHDNPGYEEDTETVDGVSEGLIQVQSLRDANSSLFHESSFPVGVARCSGRSVGWFYSMKRHEDGQRVDVIHALAEDDASQTTARRLEERVQLFQNDQWSQLLE